MNKFVIPEMKTFIIAKEAQNLQKQKEHKQGMRKEVYKQKLRH